MSPGRQRRSAQEWSSLIAECRAGGESDAEFCTRHGLSRHTFRKHKYRYVAGRDLVASRGSGFTELKVTPPAASGHIIVHSADGVRIEVPVSVGIDAVARLARALHDGR